MEYSYKTKGTCSSQIDLKVEDNRLVEVKYTGGCNGNLKGISSLVKGMPLDEVCQRLEGITCGKRSTSCPDQLAKAIHQLEELR